MYQAYVGEGYSFSAVAGDAPWVCAGPAFSSGFWPLGVSLTLQSGCRVMK